MQHYSLLPFKSEMKLHLILVYLVFLYAAEIIAVNRDAQKADSIFLLLERLDCIFDGKYTKEICENKGCQWIESLEENVPKCFIPKTEFGYKLKEAKFNKPRGLSLLLEQMSSTFLVQKSIKEISFEVTYITEDIVRFKFTDPATSRYEVPVQKTFDLLKNIPELDLNALKYEVILDKEEPGSMFSFKIKRKENGINVWDTSIGGLAFEDQFLQIASYLPAENVYGLGENNHETFNHDLNYRTWPLFTRDEFPNDWPGRKNLYGVYPFYICLEKDGKAHGVLFLNSNAMEYTLLPAPAISFKTTGGVLDFFVFIGKGPEHVVQLYTQLVGRPVMPPYWSLGFQLSRWGYNSLEELQGAVERTIDAEIPLDVQHADIDYMEDRKIFTWDKVNWDGFPEYIKETKKDGLRWIIILDPFLVANDTTYPVFFRGLDKDVYIKWPATIKMEDRNNPEFENIDNTKDLMYGWVWPDGPAVFPDYFRQSTRIWWREEIRTLYEQLKFDGLWIDMNEPSNFGTNEKNHDVYCPQWKFPDGCWSLQCPNNRWDDPPFNPLKKVFNKKLSDKTLCMVAVQGEDEEFVHYDVHSLYGWSQMEPTLEIVREVTQERSLVLSRSTFVSSGRYGSHWLGDNNSHWPDLHRSIIGMLEFNLFGIPYIGADICGFFSDTTIELCKRWMQLGAFYPFSRNHNANGNQPQDPAHPNFGGPDGPVASASRKVLQVRYTLLPYLYTLFYHANQHGNTVIRPLLHEFPTDKLTYNIDRQFMWGPALLISPVLEEYQTSVNAYLPMDSQWFNYYTGKMDKSGEIIIDDLEMPPLHVRAGYILPTQDYAQNTFLSRQNPMHLLVYPDKVGIARGDLFWDDGVGNDNIQQNKYVYLQFYLNQCHLLIKMNPENTLIQDELYLSSIKVYGSKKTATLTINGNDLPSENIEYDELIELLTLTINLHPLQDCKEEPCKVTWASNDQCITL